MRRVTKAVIPVAGLGTRVLPASKAIPKEMMPVVDKPVIQHVVEEAVAAGIKDIVLVTRSGKASVEDHFDCHYELEAELERKGKTSILEAVRNIIPADVSISAVRQHKALGLGHAVLCASPIIGDEDFAVLLPDMLINSHGLPKADLTAMVEAYQDSGHGQIMVEPVPMEHVDRYGVVDCEGVSISAGQSADIARMVEKPPVDEAPSNLTINGRYILPARIMELLKDTKPGAGGEIQLTDAMADYLSEGNLQAFHMSGKTYDCGNKAGYLQANVVYGLQHAETAESLKAFIKELDL
ncbi:UTP--glucose-1-phosphate uridylyltransferase GalU [Neptuniibacter caesariensis]|uniref:UTP--glucose-1-phosphate uridylyltransferase n=1 Tax=Neptuniibacter caesariensis TaxID=207954 RepID=A0A7U8C371_NEPCE|nr:UTP--glucose-1-phosphate uridylyltransferase GalU [Neptuniibacter caesariensis]EAR59941.1 UTP-glucose-1-phosphate uridylyltransferase [Oceanospirillum sp. MED92] [Neptuniibacter caesariensis]